MSRERHPLEGKRYGRLVLIRRTGTSKSKRPIFLCQCDCGNSKEIDIGNIKTGDTRSCGCLHRESHSTHGMTYTRTYRIWRSMNYRCYSPSTGGYQFYGAKGVTVCDRWRESFEDFLQDMGECPEGMSIDRIDNSLGYSPENCRWASERDQHRNMTSNRVLEYGGVSMILADWAAALGLSRGSLSNRLQRGWTIERALTTPNTKELK